jgi:hypothetical protein
MATRPPDFKASGVRTERIIASGSLNNPRLLIIGSGSTNSDGVNVNTDTIKLSGTGSDTWLFISGSRGGSDRVAFGGDTYFSGSIFGNNLVVSSSTITVGLSTSTGYSDTYFYVTGAAGSKNSLIKGTSIFAGDLVVSGDIYNSAGVIYTPGSSTPGGSPGSVQTNDGSGGFDGFGGFTYDDPTLTLSVYNVDATSLTGSLTTLSDGSPYLLAGSNVTLSTGSNGAVTISSTGGGGSSYWQSSAADVIFTTGSAYATVLSSSLGLIVTGSSRMTGSLTVTGTLSVYAVDGGTLQLSSSVGMSIATHADDGNFYLTNLKNGGTLSFGANNSSGVGKQLVNMQAGSTTGNIYMSGSAHLGKDATDMLFVNASLSSDIVPDTDRTRNLGSPSLRFANMYTGDLHLKNDRGDWTIIEEPEFLTITNNLTGKRFKFLMEPIG